MHSDQTLRFKMQQ